MFELFNFWTVAVLAVAGYYLLEHKKLEVAKHSSVKADKISITLDEIPSYIGIKSADIDSFLSAHKDSIKQLEVNGTVYYDVESLKSCFK